MKYVYGVNNLKEDLKIILENGSEIILALFNILLLQEEKAGALSSAFNAAK